MEITDPYFILRKIPFFADLPDNYLQEICQKVEEIHLRAGEVLFSEGAAGQQAFVIIAGQIEIYKKSNKQSISLAIRQAGDVIGEMAILDSAPRIASGRALTDTQLLAIGQESFNYILDTFPSAVRIMLHTVTQRLQSTELLLRQSEKMAQLGVLTAGIAHELNNPSAAVKRGAEKTLSLLADMQAISLEINTLQLTPAQMDDLRALTAKLQQLSRQSLDLNPIERSDRETELETWLEGAGIAEGWHYASILVDSGYGPDSLEALSKSISLSALNPVLRWITTNFLIYRLLDEVSQGSERISEIVRALKTYVFLDQGPIQEVNIHEGLENTLVILRFKLKQGITIHREFAANLPTIEAYGSELNQVWTNIIDNAIDAMEGKGEITLRTVYQAPWVLVEIRDSGPGIPEEVLPQIFNPFFTTKAVGKGTGLGLNTSYNIVHKHNGDIKVFSRPGETRFEVWLPRDRQAHDKNARSADAK